MLLSMAAMLLKSKGGLQHGSVIWSVWGGSCRGGGSRGQAGHRNSCCLAQSKVGLSRSSTMAIILSQASISEPNNNKNIYFFSLNIHMGHDQPNVALLTASAIKASTGT